MSEKQHYPLTPSGVENASAVRKEFHALSNALEVIVQSSYLLSTSCKEENSKKWISLLNEGVDRAVVSQRTLRQILALGGEQPPVNPVPK